MVEQVSSLKTGVKYKQTPIGKIPVDWEVTSLGKITYLEYGASLPAQRRIEGNVPVYGSSGIVGYHNEALLDGPGIIIGRKGTVGAVCWAENSFYPIDTTYYVSRKQSKEYLKWLFYLLSSLHLERLSITTGVPGLNREEAHSVIVPIPPLPEQKKIAEILTTVDAAIEKTDQVIEKTKELKKGLMQKMSTEGIGHTRFEKTPIGNIPQGWKIGKLSDIALVVMGQSPPGNTYNSDGVGIPVLNGPTEFTDYSPVPVQHTTKPTKLCKSGDILFCVRGSSTGRMNIADREYCIGRGLAAIRQKLNASTKFIYYLLTNITHKIFAEATGGGSTFPNISRRGLEERRIVIPPLDEQKKIASIITRVDVELGSEQDYKTELERIKKGLMQVLLTGKLRVAA